MRTPMIAMRVSSSYTFLIDLPHHNNSHLDYNISKYRSASKSGIRQTYILELTEINTELIDTLISTFVWSGEPTKLTRIHA